MKSLLSPSSAALSGNPGETRFARTTLRFSVVLAACVAFTPLLLVGGCGSGNNSSTSLRQNVTRKTGGLSVSVTWPDRTRLIPDAAESIVVTVSKAGTQLKAVTLRRPAAGQPLTTVASFDDLAVGTDYTVVAAAFPNPDASGNAQARASAAVPFVVTDNTRTPVSIVLDSTIAQITLQPVLSYPLGAGRSRTLSVVALDKDGNVVLTSPRKVNFDLAQTVPGTATLTPDASTPAVDATVTVVQAPTTGQVKLTVTATDTESGKVGTLDIFVSATGIATDASWAKFHGDLRNTGRMAKIAAPAAGTIADLSIGASSIVFASPTVGPDGTVYIGAYDGNIRAISPNGTVKWKVTTGAEVESTPVLSKDGALYIGSADGKLYCIETATGAVRFTVPVDGNIYGSPTVDENGVVYFGTFDNGSTFYAVDGLSGDIRWQKPIPGDGIQTTPALLGTGNSAVLYFGTRSGSVYALQATDGNQAYTPFQADDAIVTSSCAIADDGSVYFGTVSGKLYALNADLSPKWSDPFDAEAPIYATPAISSDGSTVYFGTLDNFSGLNQNRVYAVNTGTGTVVSGWPFATADGVTASAAIGSDGTVYVPSFDKNLYALLPNGTLKWTAAIGGGSAPDGTAIESSPGFGPDGSIYFGSTDGQLHVVR